MFTETIKIRSAWKSRRTCKPWRRSLVRYQLGQAVLRVSPRETERARMVTRLKFRANTEVRTSDAYRFYFYFKRRFFAMMPLFAPAFTYEFTHNNFLYVLSDAGYSADGRLVRFTKWNSKGQLTDTGYTQANSFPEARNKILNT
jgi:hypothetical protein